MSEIIYRNEVLPEIDWENPFAENSAGCYLFNDAIDLVTGLEGSILNAANANFDEGFLTVNSTSTVTDGGVQGLPVPTLTNSFTFHYFASYDIPNDGSFYAIGGVCTAGFDDFILFIRKLNTGILQATIKTSNGSKNLNITADITASRDAKHITLTYDGVTFKSYVEGVETNSTTHSGNLSLPANASLSIGAQGGRSTRALRQDVYALFITRDVLTAEEIQSLVTNPYQLFKTQEIVNEEYCIKFGDQLSVLERDDLDSLITLTIETEVAVNMSDVAAYERMFSCMGVECHTAQSSNKKLTFNFARYANIVSCGSTYGVNYSYDDEFIHLKLVFDEDPSTGYSRLTAYINGVFESQSVGDRLYDAYSTRAEANHIRLGAVRNEGRSGFDFEGRMKYFKVYGYRRDNPTEFKQYYWDFNQTRGDYVKCHHTGEILPLINFPSDGGYVRAWGVGKGLEFSVDDYVNIPQKTGAFSVEVVLGQDLEISKFTDNANIINLGSGNPFLGRDYANNQWFAGNGITDVNVNGVWSGLLANGNSQSITALETLKAGDVLSFNVTAYVGALTFFNNPENITKGFTGQVIKSIKIIDNIDTYFYDFTAIRGNSLIVPETINGQDGTMVGFPSNGVYVPEQNKTLVSGSEATGDAVYSYENYGEIVGYQLATGNSLLANDVTLPDGLNYRLHVQFIVQSIVPNSVLLQWGSTTEGLYIRNGGSSGNSYQELWVYIQGVKQVTVPNKWHKAAVIDVDITTIAGETTITVDNVDVLTVTTGNTVLSANTLRIGKYVSSSAVFGGVVNILDIYSGANLNHSYDFTTGDSDQIIDTVGGNHATIVNNSTVKWQRVIDKEVFTVGDDGWQDYATLELAVESQAQDLIANSKRLEFVQERGGLTSSTPSEIGFTEFGGYTTSPECNITMLAKTPHNYQFDTGVPLHLSGNYGFVCRNKHVLIDGFEIVCASVYGAFHSSNNTIVKNILFRVDSGKVKFSGDAYNVLFLANYLTSTDAPIFGEASSNIYNSFIISPLGMGAYNGDIVGRYANYKDCIIYNANAKTTHNEAYAGTYDNCYFSKPASEINSGNLSPSCVIDAPIDTWLTDPANDNYTINETGQAALTGAGWNGSNIAEWAWAETTGEISLTLNDVTVKTTTDELSLSRFTSLTLNDVTVPTTVDTLDLIRLTNLLLSDITVNTTTDTVDITRLTNLTLSDVTVPTTVDNIDVSRFTAITPIDITVPTTVDTLTLLGELLLAFKDVSVKTKTDNLDISRFTNLTLSDVTSKTTTDELTVSRFTGLTLSDVTVPTTVDPLTITLGLTLVFKDVTVPTTTDNLLVSRFTSVDINDITVDTKVDELNISRFTNLELDDITVDTKVDLLNLITSYMPTFGSDDVKLISATVRYKLKNDTVQYRIKKL